jgi:DNA-binding SARP family transcriptional activator
VFRLLGPLALATGDDEVAPATRKQRQMLAVLLLDANKPVSLERLTEELWGDDPPRSAVANLRSYAAALRALMDGADRLATVRNGYLLRVDPGERDLDVVETLAADASAAFRRRDFGAADRLLGEALAQWRGPALDGLDASPVLAARVHGIEERRLDLFEDLVETRLRLGDGKSMILTLREHLAAHPLRERAHGQLMRILYAQGDTAAALQAYQQAREILDAELGLDPGPDLTRLHQAILRREPIVDERPATVTVPRQLPPDVPDLVGRDDALAWLRSATARVRAVHGQGGVGKSALVIRLAHELADEFPDGQLYVDLQGSNPRLTPLTPAEVLGRFIRALSPALTEIPADTGEAAAIFRTLIAGRRIVMILDNAVDAAQVRPLLPGSSASLVLVTSRRALTSLENADHHALEVLSEVDALALLGVPAPEAEAARRLVEICGGLPLALRIVAARLRARPDWAVADLAARLQDEHRRLDELHSDDLEVRASIEASYRSLDPQVARAFRMAGLIRVPRLTSWALVAALDVSLATATALADVLVSAQLLETDGRGGYRLHDLVRLFAAERAASEESQSERDSAIHRVAAYYLAGVCRAIELQYGNYPPILPAWPLVDLAAARWMDGVPEAATWMDGEWRSVVALADQAAEVPAARSYSAVLTRVAHHYLSRNFRFKELEQLAQLALTHSNAEDPGLASALSALSVVRTRNGDLASARSLILRVIALRRRLDDLRGLAAAWNVLGVLEKRSGDEAAARQCFGRSEDAMRRSGDMHMYCYLLFNLAELEIEQGRFGRAIEVLRKALTEAGPVRLTSFRPVALELLGRAHAQLGEYPRALSYFERCLRSDADTYELPSNALLTRAATYLKLRRADLALPDIDQAMDIAVDRADRYRHAASVRLHAQATALAGDPDRARLEIRQAEALFHRIDEPYDRAIEEFLAGGDPTLPRPSR